MLFNLFQLTLCVSDLVFGCLLLEIIKELDANWLYVLNAAHSQCREREK